MYDATQGGGRTTAAVAPGRAFDPKRIFAGPRDGAARILHSMLRVADTDRAVRFYVNGLGMVVHERLEIATVGATATFVGFPGSDVGAPIELVRLSGHIGEYEHGTGFGHVAVGVTDVAATFERLTAMGAGVVIAPCVMAPGGPLCAFVSDFDGYAVELCETPDPTDQPATGPWRTVLGPGDGRRRLLHTMLRVVDRDAALRFYINDLGMSQLAEFSVDFRGGVTSTFVGFETGEAGRQIELCCYAAETGDYTQGTGFGHVALAVPDLFAAVDRLEKRGRTIDDQPLVLFPGAPGRAFVRDADGYRVELVQAALV